MINSLAMNMLCYQAEGLLEKVMEAVLPYVGEAHVIDTGSTDKTMSILKKIQKKYPYLEFEREDVQPYGTTWVDWEKNRILTALLNETIKKTKSQWILKVDDDEIFPDDLMDEIVNLKPPKDRYVYTINFIHVEGDHIINPYQHKNLRLVRLFRNVPEITWEGNYGTEVVAYNKHRLNSSKQARLSFPFIHLGEFRTGSWKHDYRFHPKGHCNAPIPEKYLKYIPYGNL